MRRSSIPVGPIDPATNRECSGVDTASQASRAIAAARKFISRVFSPKPYSSSFSREPVNESVSMTSAPAAR